jgi:branched-chain amino acid transport system substrate-binding protein
MRALLALMVMMLTLPAAWALPVTTSAGNPTIVVAVIASLSGPAALGGQDSLDGFTTGLRQMGGRFANQEVRVVVIDDKGSPDVALTQTRKLLEREKIDFVLTAVTPASMAAIIRPLLDSRVFVINLEGAPAGLAGADCAPALFEVGTPPDAVHEAAGSYFAAEKVRRLVVVGADAPATGAAVAALKRSWGGEIQAVLRLRHGSLNNNSEIAQIRRLAPDAVYSVLTGGMGGAFVRDFAASGLKADIPLVAAWPGFERPALSAMGDSALDMLNIAPWSPDLDTPPNKRLISDFELEYGRPVTSWVAQGYDAALLLESTMRTTSGRTTDREALRRGLRRAEFTPVRGLFRFDTNHQPSINLYLRRVTRDAKGRLTQELRATLVKDWHGREVGLCPMRWVDEPPPAPAGAQPPRPGATPPATKPRKPAQ